MGYKTVMAAPYVHRGKDAMDLLSACLAGVLHCSSVQVKHILHSVVSVSISFQCSDQSAH